MNCDLSPNTKNRCVGKSLYIKLEENGLIVLLAAMSATIWARHQAHGYCAPDTVDGRNPAPPEMYKSL